VRTGGDARCTGADGPRPGVGRSATWVSCLQAGRFASAQGQRLDLAPERDPIGEERSYVLSRLGRSTQTPLIDVESNRSGEFGDWKTKLKPD
jgi:hypothetical protein